MTCVAETTVKLAAGVPPKLTPVESVRSVPVIVTASPPAVEPAPGETTVTAGCSASVAFSISRPAGSKAVRLTPSAKPLCIFP